MEPRRALHHEEGECGENWSSLEQRPGPVNPKPEEGGLREGDGEPNVRGEVVETLKKDRGLLGGPDYSNVINVGGNGEITEAL